MYNLILNDAEIMELAVDILRFKSQKIVEKSVKWKSTRQNKLDTKTEEIQCLNEVVGCKRVRWIIEI